MTEDSAMLARELGYFRYRRERAMRACQDIQGQNAYEWLDLVRHGGLIHEPLAEEQKNVLTRHLLISLMAGSGCLTFDDERMARALFSLE